MIQGRAGGQGSKCEKGCLIQGIQEARCRRGGAEARRKGTANSRDTPFAPRAAAGYATDAVSAQGSAHLRPSFVGSSFSLT